MTRQELYDLVWSIPSWTAAKQVGVSDVYLTRVCRALDVPKPPPGFWRKRQLGLAAPPPPLPPLKPGVPRIWTKGNVARQPPAPKLFEPAEPVLGSKHMRSRRTPHSLVQSAAEHFKSAPAAADGYLRPRKKLLPDISTTGIALRRCLNFASDLFYALEARGHRPMIAPGFDELIRLEIRVNENANCVNGQSFNWSPLRPTVAYLHGVPIGLAIVEVSENRAMRYIGDGSFIPEKQYRPDLHFGPTWTVEKSQPTGKIKLIGYSPFPQFPGCRNGKRARVRSSVAILIK